MSAFPGSRAHAYWSRVRSIPQTNPSRVCSYFYRLPSFQPSSNRPNLRLYSGTIPQARGSLDGRTRATLERRSRAVQSAGACHKICRAGGASTRALRPGPVGPALCER
ncbi:unnamed protein product [Ectocarpus sp. 12 AP-2014]